MARMSVDDTIARDPRITMLAAALGWSRRETVGCLVADIWPICYDQNTWLVSERVIDTAAAHVGFAAALIESELATRDRSGKVNIKGAKERIKYLDHKKDAGRQGGLKSAESRRKAPKQTSSSGGSTPQAAGNPPVPDPSPPSAPPPDPVPSQDCAAAPPAPPFADARQALCWFAWDKAAKAHRFLKASGVDRNARDWPPLPIGEGGKQLNERLTDLGTTADKREETETALSHVIAVRIAEAKRTSSLRYFTATNLWSSQSFWKASEQSLEDATAGPPARESPGRPAQPPIRVSKQL